MLVKVDFDRTLAGAKNKGTLLRKIEGRPFEVSLEASSMNTRWPLTN